MYPTDAVLAITYRCNARCIMCDIWKTTSTSGNELVPEDYKLLPTSLKNINISGGEPFLRNDLPEVINVITQRCPNARLVFSTNGLSPKLMEKALPGILKIRPDIAIRFSLDGIDSKHQEMRGIPDAFERVMSSVNIANAFGVKDVGFAYTATNDNLDQLLEVYYLAKRQGVGYSLCGVAHNSAIEGYFGQANKEIKDTELLRTQINVLLKDHLHTWNLNDLARAYQEFGIYYREVYKKRHISCNAAASHFYMDPSGNIFSCNVANKYLGNIREESFETLWNSKKAVDVRAFARHCPHQCWMICTVSPCIRKRPLKPLLWILVNKMKAALGREVIKKNTHSSAVKPYER